MSKEDKERLIEQRLERQERKDYKVKRQKEQEDRYNDLPSHILNKLYR